MDTGKLLARIMEALWNHGFTISMRGLLSTELFFAYKVYPDGHDTEVNVFPSPTHRKVKGMVVSGHDGWYDFTRWAWDDKEDTSRLLEWIEAMEEKCEERYRGDYDELISVIRESTEE